MKLLAGAGAALLVLVGIPIAALFAMMLLASTAATGGCSGGTITAANAQAPVQLTAGQQANAQTIIGVAKTVFPDPATATQAGVVAVATAMQESGLVNLPGGDRDSAGLFQQRPSQGYVNVTDPVWAATQFLTRLAAVPARAGMTVGDAAMTVQRAATYPNGPGHPSYADQVTGRSAAAARIVNTLTPTSPPVALPAGSVSANLHPANLPAAPGNAGACTGDAAAAAATAQHAAADLIAGWKAGTLTDYETAVVTQEIQPIADGRPVPAGCQVDPRVFQLMDVLLHHYGKLTVSDINRPCVGSGLNCTFSLHCTHPSRAVDIDTVGGRRVNGSNQATTDLLTYLDTVMPKGSQTGQSTCRLPLFLTNLRQFPDACTHVHIDLGTATAPLNIPTT